MMAYLDTTVVLCAASFVAGWLFMPKVIAFGQSMLAKIKAHI